MMHQHQHAPRLGRRRKALTVRALAVATLVAGGAIAATTERADTSNESAGGFLCYTVDAYCGVHRLCGAVPAYYIPY